MSPERSGQVQVALDDAAAGEAVLALSSALARELECELAVVYVESTASVSAAALTVTQVLPHAGSPWVPLRPGDVEQGFRSHAARLRQLTERLAGRHALRWSLRVLRGSLAEAPTLLSGESTLLFLATAPAPGAPFMRRIAARRRRPLVGLASDDGPSGAQALATATRLARALDGVLQSWPRASPAMPWPREAADARPDVLVMTRRVIAPAALALLPCPVLLVG
jgi:K+-sensing histidine kinase KdpD